MYNLSPYVPWPNDGTFFLAIQHNGSPYESIDDRKINRGLNIANTS